MMYKVSTSPHLLNQSPPRRQTTTVPLKIGARISSSQANMLPELDAPSEDSISLDAELDALPDDYSDSDESSDTEPLDDLEDKWAN